MTFMHDGVHRTAEISSVLVSDYLRYQFYLSEDRPPSSQALQDARDILRAQARFDGPEREVHVRVAEKHGCYYVDLCNEQRQIVEISTEGWRTINAKSSPVIFRRSAGMKALPMPERGGSLGLIRHHVSAKDDESFVLLLAFLVGSLRPKGPYPVLELTGEQGSGKSTASRMIRAILDPSHVPISTCPRTERDLVISAENAWMLAFDNLSGIPEWLSDAFCRLSTGGGFRVRAHYKNKEEVLFHEQRPLLLNGIDDITTRGDLADRCVSLHLCPIPHVQRKTEKELWRAFNADYPKILGSLFDALSTALRRESEVQLTHLPRMADFASFIVAAEPALPLPPGTFMRAYTGNRMRAHVDKVASDFVASAIHKMLLREQEWVGTTTELLSQVTQRASQPLPRSFPTSHQALTAYLRRIMPALRGVGVQRESIERTSERRAFRLSLKSVSSASPASSATSGHKNDDME